MQKWLGRSPCGDRHGSQRVRRRAVAVVAEVGRLPRGEEEGLEEGLLLGAEDEGCLARTGWKERWSWRVG